MALVSFSCLIAVARTSNTMLNRSGKNRHPCPSPEFREKAFTFSPLSMMLTVGLSQMDFIMLSYGPFIPILMRVFIMNGFQIKLQGKKQKEEKMYREELQKQLENK